MTDTIKQNRWVQAAFIVTFGVVGTFVMIQSHAATPVASLEAENGTISSPATTVTSGAASGGSAVKFGGAGCQISVILVNSCRPLYGTAMASVTTYPQVASDQVTQIQYQDTRIGQTSDIAHTYNSVGHNALTSADTTLINDGYTLMLNWKPVSPWSNGFTSACATSPDTCTPTGAADDSAIDTMATSLKTEASHKIMLVIWHEPENDVTPGGADCTVAAGAQGSASDYVNMWRYTENRLKKIDNVTNVVYVEYFENYPPLTCNNINQLYAGDSYVDWIMFDAYVDTVKSTAGPAASWDATVNNMYNFLTTNTSSAHEYTSKPWGISEFGITNEGTANEQTWYDQAAAAVTANTYPNLKAYIDFDDNNTADRGGLGNEYRQAYDDSEAFSQPKQNSYNDLVNAIYNFNQ